MASQSSGIDNSDIGQDKFLYAVLNLPLSASAQEVRERYRALSIIYHPDKQNNELRATANKRFLEVQKAYEVLSDPFLRVVYDILGERGLKISDWPPDLRSKSGTEIREHLLGVRREYKREKLEDALSSTSSVTLHVDATCLVDDECSLAKKLSEVAIGMGEVRQRFKMDIDPKTTMTVNALAASFGRKVDGGGRNIIGTVAHQFSPRLSFEATARAIQNRSLLLSTKYEDIENNLTVSLPLGTFIRDVWPPLVIKSSRKLFKASFLRGHVGLTTGPRSPTLTLGLSSPPAIVAGQSKGILQTKSVELVLDGPSSRIEVEYGLIFLDFLTRVHVTITATLLNGINYVFSGEWKGEEGAVSTSVVLSPQSVHLILSASYLGNTFKLPILLSLDYDPPLALGAAVVPLTGFLLADYFFLRHRRREARLARLREAREDFETRRSETESRETIALLQETAAKRTDAERSISGLIVHEASYGAVSNDPELRSFKSDVTTALRALVSNSQLHIPGRRPKIYLNGFYDFLPDEPKVLKISYSFGDRPYYAEIPDDHPVTLPLAEHTVKVRRSL